MNMVNELKLESILELISTNQNVRIITDEGTYAGKAKQLYNDFFEETREGVNKEVMKIEANGNVIVIRV